MKVFWTRKASKRLRELHKFYRKAYSKKYADKINNALLDRSVSLGEFPLMGTLELGEKVEDLGVRYLVEEHCKLYYRVFEDKIEIVSVFDTHQHPDKMSI
jgi:plasmid stabilization system protein ParE